jgi:hypothetical protein
VLRQIRTFRALLMHLSRLTFTGRAIGVLDMIAYGLNEAAARKWRQ